MKLDRRGDIGFMEAMAGAMTVCIVLMAFTAYLAHDASATEREGFDWNLVDGIRLDGNGFVIEYTVNPSDSIGQNGICGIKIVVYDASDSDSVVCADFFGNETLDKQTERKLFNVGVGGNSVRPLIAEVGIYR